MIRALALALVMALAMYGLALAYEYDLKQQLYAYVMSHMVSQVNAPPGAVVVVDVDRSWQLFFVPALLAEAFIGQLIMSALISLAFRLRLKPALATALVVSVALPYLSAPLVAWSLNIYSLPWPMPLAYAIVNAADSISRYLERSGRSIGSQP